MTITPSRNSGNRTALQFQLAPITSPSRRTIQTQAGRIIPSIMTKVYGLRRLRIRAFSDPAPPLDDIHIAMRWWQRAPR